jgi:hypothetical protein
VLTARFLGSVDHARELKLATHTTVAWLGGADDLNRMSLTGSTVQVNVTGKKQPPPVRTLAANLTTAMGHPMTVDLRWTPVHDDEPAPTPPLDAVEPLIRRWLAERFSASTASHPAPPASWSRHPGNTLPTKPTSSPP